jgi:hypothetical protein
VEGRTVTIDPFFEGAAGLSHVTLHIRTQFTLQQINAMGGVAVCVPWCWVPFCLASLIDGAPSGHVAASAA